MRNITQKQMLTVVSKLIFHPLISMEAPRTRISRNLFTLLFWGFFYMLFLNQICQYSSIKIQSLWPSIRELFPSLFSREMWVGLKGGDTNLEPFSTTPKLQNIVFQYGSNNSVDGGTYSLKGHMQGLSLTSSHRDGVGYVYEYSWEIYEY